MAETIRVAVAGAGGKMGKEVIKMVLEDSELCLVAAVNLSDEGLDAGILAGVSPCGVSISTDLELALVESKPDVLVDFTTHQSAYKNTELAIKYGVRPVVGTTGFTPEQIEYLDKQCHEKEIGGLIAPNFSIGAILMMKFAAQAAKFFPHVEIIEYHGDHKLDAPSGTAINTAEFIAKNREEIRQGALEEKELIDGARGGYYNGFRIHSVRLPGVFAQQEVVFGGPGESLKIRNDSYERSSYMPGVNLAIKKVIGYQGMVYGFEQFVDG